MIRGLAWYFTAYRNNKQTKICSLNSNRNIIDGNRHKESARDNLSEKKTNYISASGSTVPKQQSTGNRLPKETWNSYPNQLGGSLCCHLPKLPAREVGEYWSRNKKFQLWNGRVAKSSISDAFHCLIRIKVKTNVLYTIYHD